MRYKRTAITAIQDRMKKKGKVRITLPRKRLNVFVDISLLQIRQNSEARKCKILHYKRTIFRPVFSMALS